QVDVSRPQLREALEELGVGRSLGLFPGGLPRFVGRKEAARIEVTDAQLVVAFEGERVEVLHRQPLCRPVRKWAAELVAGASLFGRRVRVSGPVRLRRGN